LGSSAGAALPLALGGADVFGFVLIMSLYGLCLFRIAGLLNRQSDSRTQWVIGCISRGKIACRGLHRGGFKGGAAREQAHDTGKRNESEQFFHNHFGFGLFGWIGVGDDALDDVGTFAKFAGAFVEMFAAGRTAILEPIA
jgi:hypothetical protein